MQMPRRLQRITINYEERCWLSGNVDSSSTQAVPTAADLGGREKGRSKERGCLPSISAWQARTPPPPHTHMYGSHHNHSPSKKIIKGPGYNIVCRVLKESSLRHPSTLCFTGWKASLAVKKPVSPLPVQLMSNKLYCLVTGISHGIQRIKAGYGNHHKILD